jgi:hypothetical protein
MRRLGLIVPISVFLIFILLFNAFGSVRNAAVVLVNIPLAAIGGVVALYLTGIHLSVSAAIGFIALRPGGPERCRDGELLRGLARRGALGARGRRPAPPCACGPC